MNPASGDDMAVTKPELSQGFPALPADIKSSRHRILPTQEAPPLKSKFRRLGLPIVPLLGASLLGAGTACSQDSPSLLLTTKAAEAYKIKIENDFSGDSDPSSTTVVPSPGYLADQKITYRRIKALLGFNLPFAVPSD